MDLHNEKWNSRLTMWVVGLLLFELVSGLLIYLISFSLTSQTLVIIHTLLGLVMVVPYVIYQFRHWQFYRKNKLTHHKLTGYLSMTTAVAAIISGLVLTYEAAFMTRINYMWDQVHIVSTFAFLFSLLPHIGLVIIRNFRNIKSEKLRPILNSQKVFGFRIAIVLFVLIGLVTIFAYSYNPTKFNNKFPKDYEFMYGKNKPFEPSLSFTNDGDALDARLLGNSRSCASSGCHSEIGKEWEVNAHRYAAMDPSFRAVQHNMAVEKGPASTRYCGGCHDPISLLSGSKNLDDKTLTNPMGLDEGISCVSCHAVSKVDVKGNAQYEITKPEPYMFELENGKTAKFLSDFLIRAYPRYHVATFNRTLLKTPEFCGSCHKQFIDEKVNGTGTVQLQNQYDNWRKSHWNHPGQAVKTIECRECHMPLVSTFDPSNGDALDYNRTPDDNKHRSHRFLGGNQFLPTLLNLPEGKKQVELVEKWLKGELEIPEIADKWHSGLTVPISILAPESITAGEQVGIDVTVVNNKSGHNFPTGPLDLIETWIKITVKNTDGKLVYSSGVPDKNYFLPEGTVIYRARPVDQLGHDIVEHNLWDLVGIKSSRSLYPGFTDQLKYNFVYKPEKAINVDTLFVNAELCYRKFNQLVFNRFFPGDKTNLTAPVTIVSNDQKKIIVKNTKRANL